MAPITLKATGKPFSQFANLNSETDLSQTWRVCTKVKDSLENGSRLENLAWRLWFIHNVMDTAAHFKKISSTTTRKLDKERPSVQANRSSSAKNVRKGQRQQTARRPRLHKYHQPQQHFHDSNSGSTEAPVYLQSEQRQPVCVETASAAPGVVPPLQTTQSTPPPPPPLPQQPQPVTGAQTIVSVAPPAVMDHTSIIIQNQPSVTYTTNNDFAARRDTAAMENFVLPQFSSDQDIDQVIELRDDDLFKTIFNSDMMPWMPQDRDQFMTIDPYSFQTSSQHHLEQQQHHISANFFQPDTALYVTDETMPPIPRATLHDKILSTLPPEKVASAQQALSPGAWRLSAMGNDNSNNDDSNNKQKVIINTTPSEGKSPICSNCETTNTPLWRRSVNDELLCNACGLYAKLHNAPRPRHLKNTPQSAGEGMETTCSNCGTSTTPLWRRDNEGAPLCNACGLYLKLHNAKRPLSMKTDVIKKRQRGMDMGQPRAIRVISHEFESKQVPEENELPPHHLHHQSPPHQQQQHTLVSTLPSSQRQFQSFVFSPTTFSS